MNNKELIRCALMGDKQAQEECTAKGIVLPCPCCKGKAEYIEDFDAVICVDCGLSSEREYKKAIEVWNIRPAPPIGRCGECEFYTVLGHCKLHSQEPDQYGSGAYVEMLPDDFCSYFKPREE